MPRRKKVEENSEMIVPMAKDAMNPPIETDTTDKVSFTVRRKISSPTSKVNVRDGADGNVLFTINNNTEIIVEDEKDGWCKIVGYVMSDLVE